MCSQYVIRTDNMFWTIVLSRIKYALTRYRWVDPNIFALSDAVFWFSQVVVVSSTSLPSNIVNNHSCNSDFFPFIAAPISRSLCFKSFIGILPSLMRLDCMPWDGWISNLSSSSSISCLEIFCTRSLAFLLIWFGCLFALFASFNESVKVPKFDAHSVP